MFHMLQFIGSDIGGSSEQPSTKESERFRSIYRDLHLDGQECPPNNILNALTYRYTLYYLQDVAKDTLEFMRKTEAGTALKASVVTTSTMSAAQDNRGQSGDYAAVDTIFIERLSKLRTQWECAVCYEGCT